MACNCQTEVQATLLERFKQVHPEAQNHRAEILGYAFIFGKVVTMKLATQVQFTAKHVIKKTGLLREKTFKENLIFTYCPFCGVPYNEPEDATDSSEVQP